MDQTDFSAIISKIVASDADVIVNTLNGTGNVSFFKQMSETNFTTSEGRRLCLGHTHTDFCKKFNHSFINKDPSADATGVSK